MHDTKRQPSEQIYFRQLAGGGFVAIEIARVRSLFGRLVIRGAVIVERRADRDRRHGHVAPAIAQAEGPTISSIFHKLFPVAHSDVAVAARCLARGREQLTVG